MMGMKPVKLQSESELTKSISTESKVFSIYAIGVVKLFNHTTRVKIHKNSSDICMSCIDVKILRADPFLV
jgi:hypothetical protein